VTDRRRRRFIQGSLALAGVGLLGGCGLLPSRVEPPKVARIGYLAAGSSNVADETLRDGLRELGYTEGLNLAIEWRFAEGSDDRLAEFAADLVAQGVAVIVANSTVAIRAAQQSTETIPIVMSTTGSPLGTGELAGLPRPDSNLTGLTNFSPVLSGKRLELLKDAVAGLSQVAVVWNPTGPTPVLAFKETEAAAARLGVRLQSLEVRNPEDFDRVFEAAVDGEAEALVTIQAPITVSYRTQIIDFAARARLPAMYPQLQFAEAGGLLAYGPNQIELSRRAAAYIDKILKGAKPADLPVEQPTTFDFVVNLKTAQALGLTIPQSVLQQATEVVQ
jgi:putative ABC transport system substrate-binding protein